MGSISSSRSLRNNKAADQVTAMDSYQSYFRKLDIFLSRKQHGAIRTNRKNLLSSSLSFLLDGKNVQSSYIIFDIFNDSTFFGAVEKTNEKQLYIFQVLKT